MNDRSPHSDERALRERLADLASEIPPDRNLFPEIAARLWVEDGAEAPRSTEAREPSFEGEPRARSAAAAALWRYRFPLIAAAALILIVTTVIMMMATILRRARGAREAKCSGPCRGLFWGLARRLRSSREPRLAFDEGSHAAYNGVQLVGVALA